MFGPGFVVPLEPVCSGRDLFDFLSRLLEERQVHLDAAQRRYNKLADTWSWERRVADILRMAGIGSPQESAPARQSLAAGGR